MKSIETKKLLFGSILVGGILILGIVNIIRNTDGVTKEESINDVIRSVENSHDMARITLRNSNRVFTLLVEKEDSHGNSNFRHIDDFIITGKTILTKKANSSLVYLINKPSGKFIIQFKVDSDGDLICGKVVE